MARSGIRDGWAMNVPPYFAALHTGYHAAFDRAQGATRRSRIAPDGAFMRRCRLGRRPAAVPLRGAAQILLCGCLFAQLAETAPAERLLDALAQFVRFAKQAAGSRLFRSFTFVVHVVVRCQHK